MTSGRSPYRHDQVHRPSGKPLLEEIQEGVLESGVCEPGHVQWRFADVRRLAKFAGLCGPKRRNNGAERRCIPLE